MQLPTAHCPQCKRNTLTYWGSAACTDPMTASLGRYCADCDTSLDRFGGSPSLHNEPLAKLILEGYRDLDLPGPELEASCRTNSGCESCPKLSTRPF